MPGREPMQSDAALPIADSDIRAAAARIAGLAQTTPLIENAWLNAATGARVLVKPECLQHTGSFKIRGASNRLARLTAQERRAGVVAFSSGNHAQGVAAAAERLGIRATIVMPSDAPALKRENTRAHGAELRLYDRARESRETVAADIAETTGAVLVPSFDDADIMAGQGTVGLEIAEQAEALGAGLDTALTPIGGGGLIAGCATALQASFPDIQVIGAEPEGFDDAARSLAAGERLANAPAAPSICDALLAPSPGALPFAVMRARVAFGLAVSDQEVIAAMRFGFERLKLALEPGGAVALAALLAGKLEPRGKTIALVLSGGNLDRETFCDLLTG